MISERVFAKSFSSFWRELVPLLTPRFVGLFNEAYRKDLVDKSGSLLRAIPIEPGTRADMVAEFAFWGARLLHDSGREAESLLDEPETVREASRMAFEVVQKYEGARPDVIEPLSPSELRQGLALTKNYASLYRACLAADHIESARGFRVAGS